MLLEFVSVLVGVGGVGVLVDRYVDMGVGGMVGGGRGGGVYCTVDE